MVKLNRYFFHSLMYGDFPPYTKTYPFVLGFGLVIILLSVLVFVDGYFLVMLGLGIDIVGAILIIAPLLNQYERYEQQKWRERSKISMGDYQERSNIWNDQNQAKLGLSILVMGFLLQILGNYFQYLSQIE